MIKTPKSENKNFLDSLNLNEIKNEITGDYTGYFRLVGGEHKMTTALRFKYMEHFESYIINIDKDYDADDTVFTSYKYKINTPDLFLKLPDQHREKTDFKEDIAEAIDSFRSFSMSRYCFIKCTKYLTGKYKLC